MVRRPADLRITVLGGQVAGTNTPTGWNSLLRVDRDDATPPTWRPGDEPRLSDHVVDRHRPRHRVTGAPNTVLHLRGLVGAVHARVGRMGAIVPHHPHPA